MKPNIRIATRDDLDAVLKLERIGYDSDHFGRRQFRYLLTKANAVTLVINAEQGIVGMCVIAFHRRSRTCRIYNITVHPEHRRSGYAKSLLEEAERLAISRGVGVMRLEVRQDNDIAINFYERYGFVRGERKPNYYEGGKSAWVYRKRLSPGPGVITGSR